MSTKPRPTLDSLSDRFVRKAAPAVMPLGEAEASTPAAPEKSPRAGERDTRVQILTRIDPATRKRLKLIAVEQDRTIQDICEEAIRDFVIRNSK
ncbi:ribbon-helix-helix domain-containing protein [Methylobacterium flocculans]|uniref:ribbon-helix-helix domain-containing protein n=1 Tax=Methylobacterium flocculans TaxID=2984843 RepID=UPI0021F329D3|nr:ribbon-helix-helix domain-containing protein [Methylobacterium sp. FF17]